MTEIQVKMANAAWNENLNTPGREKEASNAVDEYTRGKLREDGVYRTIIPMVPITYAECDVAIHTDKPIKIVEREPDSPGAMSIPFGTLPKSFELEGSKYAIGFSRIVTRKMTKDLAQLGMYKQDIRQIVGDNAVKDAAAEEDSQWFNACNSIMIAPDTPTPWSLRPQWVTLRGGITRNNAVEATKVMPSNPSSLDSTVACANNVTLKEFMKWTRDEAGGDSSQDILKSGMTTAEFLKNKWIGTIKRLLVPDSTIFFYADPSHIGKSYELEPMTMYVKKDAYLMESFNYETIGGGIGFPPGITRVDFA